MEIPTIFEDNDILVINKPAHLLVHPVSRFAKATRDESETLIEFLVSKYPNAELVHRLDQDTSGIMVVAKNHQTAEFLKQQFKDRIIKKKYVALVYGILKEKKGIIVKSISKSRKRGGSQTTAPIGKNREAITRYEIIQEFPSYSLLEVSPETGRTHQIRVHLASIGHPIVGDDKYKFKRQKTIAGLNRQFLHAKYLKLSLLDGEIKEFYAELPEELSNILKNL
ncbi:MAG TPA: RluA family pseudouridine synthase [Candidatus Portnoybacteria bacterium]|nr:RluA family pseudouridine synthase [Candidatus Portnoybacteria bacterium]MDD5752245.1 RluA family pseudouridine synthase [Candidatus Portnoybacteria bacterium]HNU96744.1 RluA family pseudouridine synthase [Candidatus Portnoybacteria bacterium]HOZ16526.1 RluA family pseudouridine synthase [Candidatus Portnoybacteria bacterium]HPH52285.1 RluA family pseudouridine synthase [Candidatus Portnoybacteria bacterium]